MSTIPPTQTVTNRNGLKTPSAEPVTYRHGLKSPEKSNPILPGDKLSPGRFDQKS